jgi:hypothetical protein
VQGDGQFDDTEARAEMPAGAGDRLDQVLAQLARDLGQFALVELAQICRSLDAGKARIALGVNHYGTSVNSGMRPTAAAVSLARIVAERSDPILRRDR